jgi:hypothetical protein
MPKIRIGGLLCIIKQELNKDIRQHPKLSVSVILGSHDCPRLVVHDVVLK